MDFPHTSSSLVLLCLPSGRCGWTQENTLGHLSHGTISCQSGVSRRKSRSRQSQECWEGRHVLARVKPGGCAAASGSPLGG